MSITVVICARNEEKFLERCLIAIKNQKVKPDEILVVDNASTDRTHEIAKKYADRVLLQPKTGLSWAREMAFDKAKGDIIARCDADSYPEPNWLGKILNRYKKDKFDLLGGALQYYDFPGKSDYGGLLQKGMRRLLGHSIVYGPNMIIAKSMWLKIRDKVCKNDRLIHEDIDLSIHVHIAGGKILYDSRIKVFTSARRIKFKPQSFFIEYPFKLLETIRRHRGYYWGVKKPRKSKLH